MLVRDVSELGLAPELGEPGSWEWDINRDQVHCSADFAHMHGHPCPSAGVPLCELLSWIHPDDRASVERAIRQSVERLGSLNLMHRLVRADGQVRTVRVRGTAVAGREGPARRFVATVQDLTLQIAADATIRGRSTHIPVRLNESASARVRDVLESVSDLFFSTDLDWRLTYVNHRADAYLRYLGRDPHAMIGRRIWDTIPELIGSRFQDAALRAAAERREVEVEDWFRLPGVEQCFAARFAPAPEGMVCYARDVTPRKRAEAAAAETLRLLRESEERFRVLVESVDDVVFRLDRDQRCVDVFGRWLERQGLKASHLVGHTVGEILGSDRVEVHEAASRRVLAGETVVYEWELTSPQGLAVMETSLAPLLGHDGEIIGIVGIDRDLTRRVQAEREIQRLNADLERRVGELQALLEVIPIGIGIAHDAECSTMSVNHTFAQMLGVPDGFNIARTGPNAPALPYRVLRDGIEIPPDALPLQRAAASGQPVSEEMVAVMRNDGLRFDALCFTAPLYDEAGRVRGSVGAFMDVTEMKRREEQLRLLADSSQLLGRSLDLADAAALEQLLAGIARMAVPALADFTLLDLFDENGNLRRLQLAHVDHTLEEALGPEAACCMPDPAWTDHPFSEVLWNGTPALLTSIDDEMIERMARSPRAAEFIRRLAPCSLMAVALRAHGQPIGTITFGYSTSRRRHTAQDLAVAADLAGRAALAVENARFFRAAQAEIRRRAEAESEASRWAFIFQHAAWGIGIVTPDGELIDTVNPAYAQLHGYTPEELQGRPVLDLFPPHRHAEVAVQYRRVREQGHHIWESEHQRKDGTLFPVLVDVAAIRGTDGALLCFASAVQDLTERKRAEEQIRQAQKMDAVGRLAGGVAHDFNNMLMIILGFCDFLLGSFDETDARRGDVVEIRKAADRASTLTRQLLGLGYPRILTRQVVDLNDVIRDLDPMLRPLIREDIRLVHSLSAGLGGVAADRGQLEQMITNLALNARDAMAEGGRLMIETINVDLPEGYAYRHVGIDIPAGPYALLVVSDTGSGMDPMVKARLFEPFFSTKPGNRNTGLGLATVYSIVTQMGGFIWVDSEPGQGAAFKICLPRVEPVADGGDGRALEAPVRGGQECLLVAEDEEAVRALAGRILARLGYVVLEAANGREALQIARTYPGTIDLLLTDVVMPEMGGLELIDALTDPRPGIGVVVMSGYLEPERLRSTVRDAGVPFLPKPFSPENLARRVREVLDRRAPVVMHHNPA